ncbi:chlorophyll synthesis pathway protein BchC [Limnohabitans sp. B9-3]|uniref:chlorophyll synthesis pathway protein BchC n=1 Tax=Limnohabitans sp. B9-3 TaxID=1100707 RepID=UPI000C1DC77A|nr:chlorophyll synthesis pathway protein BchC [Limnohabitans sp. B9-3]PIT73705.1 chlorophyll synthesis pathway protein BchC [Limnohabitans sp. B9-3]
MKAKAIVFEAPQSLRVRELELAPMGPLDLEVEVSFSGISTGTERLLWDGTMPPFPGLSYPLVPGYETVGTVVDLGADVSGLQKGDQVFLPGSYAFQGVANLFGGAGSRLVVPHDRAVRLDPSLGNKGVLLALAATAHHVFTVGREGASLTYPDLIVGHGIMGRLLARMVVAAGKPAPVVWETQTLRQAGAMGYDVIHPNEDTRKDYRCICDVSGDAGILKHVIPKMAPGGEVILAGFYKQDLSFAYAPAFMREASIRVAAQWKKQDLDAVVAMFHDGSLSLDGLITHTEKAINAQHAYEVAFGDPQCLKMVIDWTE